MFESPSQPVHLNPNEHSNEANALPGLSRGAHVRTPKGPKGPKGKKTVHFQGLIHSNN
jgi:hypothetical protein